jgi:hypothetical protein
MPFQKTLAMISANLILLMKRRFCNVVSAFVMLSELLVESWVLAASSESSTERMFGTWWNFNI